MSPATIRLYVTDHALSRWRERATKNQEEVESDDTIRMRIGRALLRSRPVRLVRPAERISKAISHGSLATFHHQGSVVLVVADHAVVSVYAYDRSRWESA